ncbi:hypothetical protein J2S98_004438 [Arthrobacter oryzae]|uniref:hypothetical protein n=1 Tax=Arthrobacter oryzae TaxID=409290 RepID=UPI002782BC2E|nr:hypothetical protein [Arthrobacter oryzae]MDP9989249.1 hypothetical protein [Arthrobacter oryzae]
MYAINGALLCLSRLVAFTHLARHPELTEEEAEDSYFARERPRAVAGVLLYLAAGTVGVLDHPLVASVIFVILPVFYGLTSQGSSIGQPSFEVCRPNGRKTRRGEAGQPGGS